MTQPLRWNGAQVDLSARFVQSSSVAASPATAAETIVCQTAAWPQDPAVVSGVFVSGVVSLTLASAATSLRIRIRQTNLSGTVIADTGATTPGVATGAVISQDIQGVDTAATLPGQVYVLSVTVGGATATSTVATTNLTALAI